MSFCCQLCGQTLQFAFHASDMNQRRSRERFSYYRCERCGLLRLLPVPADLGSYYPQDYYAIPPTLDQLALEAEQQRYKIDLIRRYVAGGRLLEIGPAYGSFAYLAQQAGFAVEAIEMDSRCCQFLREQLGIRAIESDDAAAALAAVQPPDVIALWHVVEHLPNPWDVLAAAAARLRPGGLLVVAAPNPDALQFRILGRLWAHVDAPRHLSLIPAELLITQLRHAGLLPLLLTTTDQGGLGWNRFGWQQSLGNLVPAGPARALARLAGRAIGVALRPIERHAVRGSAYTLIVQKEA